MSTIEEFNGTTPTWCPGCGDWAVGMAIKSALVSLELDPSSVFVVFGIGCSGNMNDFLNAYALHSLHGRSIPNAIGMKLANHKMPVIAIVGDGDCYGEGGNHFLHACRGNHDITVITHDNGVYGLTTGQAAPTSNTGMKTKSTPNGLIEQSINPLTFALTQGATFVAQSFAGDLKHAAGMIKAGISHKGFSLVNILQPCVTFNKINTYKYYYERIYHLEKSYKANNLRRAVDVALDMNEEKFPLGVLYDVNRPVFHELALHIEANQTLQTKSKFLDTAKLLAELI